MARTTKAAAKKAAYAETMAAQPAKLTRTKARWVKHSWDADKEAVVTQWCPGFMPRPSSWHRKGSIDEIEARENAGQRKPVVMTEKSMRKKHFSELLAER